MILSIATAAASVVLKQVASVAITRTSDWLMTRRIDKECPSHSQDGSVTMEMVIWNMDAILEESYE